ncbi:ParA family protein [Rhodoblastus sp.]|uniref:ParA family protein n=1 Tax=Rhodoblastus sp. TaxID=1962975 RepID=UPI003F9CB4A9
MDNHDHSLTDDWTPKYQFDYKSYCVSNLRGGIGKSTLTFNLAYMFSRHIRTLVIDLCPQKNLTEAIVKHRKFDSTILSSLRPLIMGPAFGVAPEEISSRLSELNSNFNSGKKSYLIPGDSSLFAFPPTLYQALQQAVSENNSTAVRNILFSLKNVISDEMEDKGCGACLMDCSPFYAGATHLGWCAADAIIIPVRVDEHSIESLDMTLEMLGNPDSDFNMWAKRAGGFPAPRVASIVMTMVGARSPKKGVKDLASQMYVERAYRVALKYAHLFDHDDPADAFAITDDFMSAGRISGAKRIPIPNLRVGEFTTVEGKRLQVNESQAKYRRELEYLTDIL